MTTMTHSETALSRTRDSVFVKAALIVFFWIIAAALVVGAHASPGTNSYPVAVAVKVHTREPALILLETEQCAGEVEQHSLDVVHPTIVPGVKRPPNG